MANQWHVDWLKEGVDRWNRRRKKVDFSPDLSGVNFFKLLPKDFRDSPKTSRYFERIDLSEANLVDADLSGLNFSKANFSNANISSSDMSLSNFSDAVFRNTNLQDVNAKNSVFDRVVFESANFDGVNFEDAEADAAIFVDSPISELQLRTLGVQSSAVYETYQRFEASKSNYADRATKDRSYPNLSRETKSDLTAHDGRTKKNRYDVFFGTNRIPVVERGSLVGFDCSASNELRYGICEVIVPDGHRVGSLGSSIWKRLWNMADDRLRVDALISLDRELFFENLIQASKRMKVKEKPIVFVHGFNNSFEDAVLRAAQIGFDLGIGQGIGLYSWPSAGGIANYNADEAASESSKYLLADFIEQFVETVDARSVNLIAHSMGCRCLLGALEVLASNRIGVLRRVNQVILAVADVDSAIMPNLGKAAVNYCKRTTSYISDRDRALELSGWLHGLPRIGFAPPTFVMDGMDSVWVNKSDLGNFSHGYVSSSRDLLNDIFALLKRNLPPEERFSVEAVTDAGLNFWRLKE